MSSSVCTGLRVGRYAGVRRRLDLEGLGVRADGDDVAVGQQARGRDVRARALVGREALGVGPVAQAARAEERDVARAGRDAGGRLDRVDLLGRDRLARAERVDAAVGRHVVEHAAPPERRDL
jgi:hypothetical protein